jgi:hypothetical protein
MVVDSFERDFYVNSKVLTAYNKPASFNAVQASMPYSTQNNYALFNSYTDQNRVRVDNVEVAMRLNLEGKLKAHQKSLISHNSVTEVEINDIRSIMTFSYFLGRIANLTDGMEVSHLKKALNKKFMI